MTKRARQVTLEMLQQRFDKPLSEVAVELGVCMTFLKKVCRKHGIKRWPFRKVRAHQHFKIYDDRKVASLEIWISWLRRAPETLKTNATSLCRSRLSSTVSRGRRPESRSSRDCRLWPNSSLSIRPSNFSTSKARNSTLSWPASLASHRRGYQGGGH